MLTCLDGWARVVCVLDNLNHLLPDRLMVKRLCDAHGRHLLDDMELAEADMTEAEFDARMAAGVPVDTTDAP